MTTVDKRIVEMGFDNKQFESGIKDSLKTIDSLKKGLNLEDAAKGLINLASIGKSFSLANIATNVESIANRFSVMGIAGMTVIQNLTEAAIGLAEKLIRVGLGVDYINAGFAEYEKSTESVQTILANTTGETLETVTAALADLNKYANLTKFSFGDMTTAIGTMTAQGITLDKSIPFIKGIFNATAMVGKGAMEANILVRQLSQAIGSGTVRLQDWMSVENQGMGGTKFQNQLIQTAKAHGVAVDAIIKQEGSFRNSLAQNWLTTDILVETFNQYSGDLTAEEIKAMGMVQKAGQQYALLTKEQVKSLNLSKSQLTALKLNETTAAAIGANYTATQLKNLGLTQQQIGLVTKYYSAAQKTMTTATKTMGGYSDAQIQQILTLGATALESATKLKTYSQVMETITSNLATSWAATFKIVIGDINEASDLWTFVGNTIGSVLGSSSDARNKILQEWKDLGGRTALVESLKLTLEALMNIGKAVGDVIAAIFPPVTGKSIYYITYNILLLANAFKKATENTGRLSRIFAGVAAIFQIAFQAISAVVGAVARLVGGLTGPLTKGLDLSVEGIFNFLAGIGDWIVGLKDMLKVNDSFNVGIQKIGEFIGSMVLQFQTFLATLQPVFQEINDFLYQTFTLPGSEVFKKFLAEIGPPLEELKTLISNTFSKGTEDGVTSFADRAKTGFDAVKKALEPLGKVFAWFGQVATALWPIIQKIGTALGTALSGIGDTILNSIKGINGDSIAGTLKMGLFAALIIAFKKFIDQGKTLLGGITGILDGVKDSLTTWQNSLKAKTLMTIALAIAILAASLIALSLVDSDKLSLALISVSAMFAELVMAMNSLDKVKVGGGNLSTIAAQMIALSIGVLILSIAVKKLSEIDMDAMTRGLIGIGVLLTELSIFMKKTDMGGMNMKGAVGIVIFAGAVLLMSKAVESFGKMDLATLTKGLGAIGVVLTELGLFLNKTVDNKQIISTAIGLGIFAGAIFIMSIALKAMGNLTWEEIARGLTALSGSLAMVGLVLQVVKSEQVLKTGAAVLVIAGAMMLMSVALKALGNLTWEEMFMGLLAVAGSLTIMGQALNLVKNEQVMKTGVAILLLSGAMLLMSVALKALGNLSPEEMAKGLGTVAIAMGIFVVALNLMKSPLALAAAAAILVLATALTLLVPVLFALGSMPWQVLVIGLLAIAGTFAILGAAGAILSFGPIIPTLYALAGVIGIFSLALVGVGLATTLFAGALATIAVVGVAAGSAITIAILGMANALPPLMTKVVEAIKQFSTEIVAAEPVITANFKAFLRGAIEGILSMSIEFSAALLALLIVGLATLVAAAPLVFEAGFAILIELLKGIKNNIGEITVQVIEIVLYFVAALASQLWRIIKAGFELLISFLDGLNKAIKENGPRIVKEGAAIAKTIIEGIVEGIKNGIIDVGRAIEKLASDAWEGFKDFIEGHSPSKLFMRAAYSIPQGIALGITSKSDLVDSAIVNLGKSTIAGFGDAISHISDTVADNLDMNPTIRPVLDLTDIIAGNGQINGLLASKSINVSGTTSKVSNMIPGSQSGSASTQINQPAVPGSISFTQINNSPKALSAYEIYRQTRNQLTTFNRLAVAK